jgi:hypothetical protein
MKKQKNPPDFEIDEVVEVKGVLFKVVLIDYFTDKIGLKCISKEEAVQLKRNNLEEK